MRHIICNKDGLVVNVIIWEGAEWLPPKNHYVIYSPVGDIGDMYDLDEDVLVKNYRPSDDPKPVTEAMPPTLDSLQEQINILKSLLNK